MEIFLGSPEQVHSDILHHGEMSAYEAPLKRRESHGPGSKILTWITGVHGRQPIFFAPLPNKWVSRRELKEVYKHLTMVMGIRRSQRNRGTTHLMGITVDW